MESIVKAPGKSLKREIIYLLTGFHIGFWVGEEKQDGSRMIVVCESTLTHAYVPTRGSGVWGPPRKILNLDPFRLLLTKSGTRLMFNTCVKTIITYLISRFLEEGVFPAPLPPSVWNPVWLNAPFLYPLCLTLHFLCVCKCFTWWALMCQPVLMLPHSTHNFFLLPSTRIARCNC